MPGAAHGMDSAHHSDDSDDADALLESGHHMAPFQIAHSRGMGKEGALA